MKFLNKIFFIILVLLISSTYSLSQVFKKEKLVYDIDFRVFSAGEATFETTIDTLNNEEVFKIISKTRTNKFLDRFYKIRDQVEIWIDKKNYSLLKVNKKIKEGGYKRNFSAIIDKNKSVALFKNKELKIPIDVFDPTGVIYYYRTLNLNKNNEYNFFSFDEGKVQEISLIISGVELIKTPLGQFQCYIIKPFSKDGKKLFKNNGQMTIWISNDEKKLPVKIEQNTAIGKLILNLKKII